MEDLFLDALLTSFIIIDEVGAPKILPLDIRAVLFLAVGLHAVDVPLHVVMHAWVICIHAHHHVLAIAKF